MLTIHLPSGNTHQIAGRQGFGMATPACLVDLARNENDRS